jgi:beta-galactosidase GanA
MRIVCFRYKALLEPLVDYMYGNNGPIIMVQLENEYGASGLCDKPYLNFLKLETGTLILKVFGRKKFGD